MLKFVTTKYAERIKVILETKVIGNPKYMYYSDGPEMNVEMDFPSLNHQENMFMISVDKDDNILGLIKYRINGYSHNISNIGLMGFENNPMFIMDLIQSVDDIFNVYKYNKIEFSAFRENSAARHYAKFIEKINGRYIGYFEKSTKLMDNELHDCLCYEIMKEDYKPLKGFRYKKGGLYE